MLSELRNEMSLLKVLIILLITAVGLHLLGLVWQVIGNFSDVLVILIFSWFLGFILEPLVEKISLYTKIPRVWSTLLTFLIMFILLSASIFYFIPILVTQIQALTTVLPAYLESSPRFMDRFSDSLLTNLSTIAVVLPTIVAQFVFSFFLVLIIAFYLIIDKDKITEEIYDLAPDSWHPQMRSVQELIDTTFASFLRVQVTFSIISGIATWIIMTVMGVGFAALTGIAAGILTFIPVIGPPLALIPPVMVGYIVDPQKALILLLVLVGAQQVIFSIWGPKFMGNVFKMHPAIILISTIVGFKIAGGIGGVFAIPILAISVVLLRDVHKRLFKHKIEA